MSHRQCQGQLLLFCVHTKKRVTTSHLESETRVVSPFLCFSVLVNMLFFVLLFYVIHVHVCHIRNKSNLINLSIILEEKIKQISV